MDKSWTIQELEEEVETKQCVIAAAMNWQTLSRPVLMTYEGAEDYHLTPEQVMELHKARDDFARAQRCLDTQGPVLAEMEQKLEELRQKQTTTAGKDKKHSIPKEYEASVYSIGTTIKMITARTEQELLSLNHEFEVAKNGLEDKIEDTEASLRKKKIPAGAKTKLKDELAQLRKHLSRLERDHQMKTRMINEAAEAEKNRVIAEKEEEHQVPPLDLEQVKLEKQRRAEEWAASCTARGPRVDHNEQRYNFIQPAQQNFGNYDFPPSPPPEPAAVNPDKDTLLLQLMQTQLGFLQKNQGSYSDKRLPDFAGDPSDWGNFQATFQRTQKRYNFEDSENMSRLQGALKGKAREVVKHLMANVGNVQKIMQVLEQRFGRPEFILDFLMEKAKSCKKPDSGKPETIVDFGTAVEDLVTNICAYNEEEYLYNKQLVVELVEKLPGTMKGMWYRWLTDNPTRKTNLRDFSVWLSKEVEVATLQIKPTMTMDTSEEKPSRPRRNYGSAHMSEGTEEKIGRKPCPVCNVTSHGLDNCWSLKKKTLDERQKIVKDANVCLGCLKPGHVMKNCREARTCGKDGCTQYHHRLLHMGAGKGKSFSSNQDGIIQQALVDGNVAADGVKQKDGATGSVGLSASVIEGIDGPLAIVPVRLKGPKGVVRLTYALLDNGASRTLIKSTLADELDLTGPTLKYSYKTMSGKIVHCNNAKKVNMQISGKYRHAPTYALTDVVTVDEIGVSPYSLNVDEAKRKWPHLRRYKGPLLNKAVPEIVIGGDHVFLMMHKELLYTNDKEPVGLRTVLGWTLQGKLNPATRMGSMFYMGGANLDETLHNLILESFQLDDYGVKDPIGKCMSIEDKRALEIMKKNTYQREDGRWETALLWKDKQPFPSDGYKQALASLERAEKKMRGDPNFDSVYKAKIKEYLHKGYLRKLDSAEKGSPLTRYISHFGVVNPNKPGKFRLVFNAAEKADGVSLNDRLVSGPDLLRPLPAVLSNFRRHAVVICGDIEDMFHRVFIKKEDQCSQRLLWRDGESERPPDIYEMVVMIFGATSSPSSAIFVKNANAEKYAEIYREAVRAIKEDMYCDDLLSGTLDVTSAIKLRDEITKINASGGMVIKKWISNSEEVMKSVPVELRLDGGKVLTEKSLWNTERILGLWWDPVEDHFTFKLNFSKVSPEIMEGKRPTKRQMSSLLMSLFDPLGFVGHYRIKGMIILQKVWCSEVDWDELIPEELYQDWSVWLGKMRQITGINVPRCYSRQLAKAVTQLHCFVDASAEAISAVCYFRIQWEGNVELAFVASRVKVAPKKKLTIPRLELEAAVLGCKLAARIQRDVKVEVTRRYFWSDSSTVLSWITSDSCRYKEYVANRITKIQSLSSAEEWRWIGTNDNVADDATRSQKKTDLTSNSRWLQGPEFLKLEEENWPIKRKPDEDWGLAAVVVGGDDGQEVDVGVTLPEIDRFSGYFRLLRATAAVAVAARFWLDRVRKVKNLQPPWQINGKELESSISAAEVIEAERKLIVFVQQQNKEKIIINSRKFKVVKDEHGILRMIGRIDGANCGGEDMRSPILLPPRHHFVDLLVDFEHVKNAHTGRNTVYNALRQRFWIPDGRHAVRRSWTRCYFCKIGRAKPVIPEMGNLPSYRLEAFTPPFTHTGVDMFGPIEVTVGRHHEKRWGMLLTDMVTRGIHLEVTSGLSCDTTMMALSRFMDSRGVPQHFFSDNGTNFQAAAKELANREKYLGTQWHFIPPASPHMGGAWESLVKQVKRVLHNLLLDKYPKDEVLLTAFKAVENVVNSRPLGFVSGDNEDPESLTPNHFLRGVGIGSAEISSQAAASGSSNLGENFDEDKFRWGKLWEKAQALAQTFWERWSKEVLPGLLRRNKWNATAEPIQVGDIVIMVDDQKPRNTWIKAVVTKIFPGKDQAVRVAEVTTRSFETKTTTTYKRAVAKLCPIGLRVRDLDPSEDKVSKSGGRKWKNNNAMK